MRAAVGAHVVLIGPPNHSFYLGAWGQPRGIDGFVRQNSGFELIKCSFEDGLTLVKNLNATGWLTSFQADSGNGTAPRRCLDRWPPDEPQNRTQIINEPAHVAVDDLMLARVGGGDEEPFPSHPRPPPSPPGDGEHPPPPPGRRPRPPGNGTNGPPPGRRYGPPGGPGIPFQNVIMFEWARTAAAVYSGPGEYRVKLDTGTFVTAYGRAGLIGTDSPNTTDHRLLNLTREAAEDLRRDIATFFRPLPTEPSPSELRKEVKTLTGISWRDVADQIVSRYGDRLPELFAYLNAATSSSSANETKIGFESARMLVSMLLVPYHDLSPTISRDDNLQSCTNLFVPDLGPEPELDAEDDPSTSSLYPSERVVAKAIQYTQHAICETLLFVHEEISRVASVDKPKTELLKKAAGISRDHISELMNKLRWTSWKSCDRKCSHNEICLITLWPLSGTVFFLSFFLAVRIVAYKHYCSFMR